MSDKVHCRQGRATISHLQYNAARESQKVVKITKITTNTGTTKSGL